MILEKQYIHELENATIIISTSKHSINENYLSIQPSVSKRKITELFARAIPKDLHQEIKTEIIFKSDEVRKGITYLVTQKLITTKEQKTIEQSIEKLDRSLKSLQKKNLKSNSNEQNQLITMKREKKRIFVLAPESDSDETWDVLVSNDDVKNTSKDDLSALFLNCIGLGIDNN